MVIQGLTPHYMYCMLISTQTISHSVSKVHSQGKKLKFELKTAGKASAKETGMVHRLAYLKLVPSSLFIDSRISLMLKIFKRASSRSPS